MEPKEEKEQKDTVEFYFINWCATLLLRREMREQAS